MKVFIGADHAGFELKEKMKDFVELLGYTVRDMGNWVYDKDDDYPDFALKVSKEVTKGKGKGILFCGSAEGMCIAANKVKGVRAVAVDEAKLAEKAREHNDANVLCLSGWYTKPDLAKKIIKVFLKTKFSGVKRHIRRINKIKKIEMMR